MMRPADDPQAFRTVGSYEMVSSNGIIARRGKFVRETAVTAKLPDPVNIKTKFTVMEQPARNINDPNLPSINDLDFSDQEHALGKDPNEIFRMKHTRITEKLRETQHVQPFIRPPPTLNDKQIKQLLERV